MYHKEWDHNAMVPGIFEDFATEINAKIAERVAKRNREIAKKLIATGKLTDEEIASTLGLSLEDIAVLRSQLG